MAAITSAGSGNWNSTTPNAPWPSGIVPVSGDTVTIANGHTVTIPTGYTAVVGSSPADDTGTPAIQTASATGTGILVMQDGSGLTFKGPIRQTNANWVIGAGCTITHDSSSASVPSAAHYSWRLGSSGSGATKLTVNGTAGNRTTFQVTGSPTNYAGGFSTTTVANDQGQLVASYTTFNDWGSTYFNRPWLSSAGSSCTLDHCIGVRCGGNLAFDIQNGTNFRFKDSSWKAPRGSYGWGADPSGNGFSASPTTGDRRIENAFIEGYASLIAASVAAQTGLHVVNAVLAGTTSIAPIVSGGLAPTMAEWNNVLVYNRGSGDVGCPSVFGTLTRSILLRAGAGGSHFIDTITHAVTYDGWIAEVETNISTNGDLFQTATNTTAHFAVGVLHGLALPAPDGSPIGSLVNHSDSTPITGAGRYGPQVTANHNTEVVGDGGFGTSGGNPMGCGGEQNNGFAGLHVDRKANLAWRATSGVGFLDQWNDANIGTLAAGTYGGTRDYNGFWNVPAGIANRYAGSVSRPTIYTSTPGAHDVTLGTSPNFVDSTRRFLSWARTLDGTVASWADVLDRFSRMNDDAGAIAGLTVSACYDWIRAGFVPQNTAINTSYPGDAEQFLGFVQAVAAGPTAQQKLFYRRLQYAASIAALLLSPVLSLLGARHV